MPYGLGRQLLMITLHGTLQIYHHILRESYVICMKVAKWFVLESKSTKQGGNAIDV